MNVWTKYYMAERVTGAGMICDKVKECSEKTRHVPPSEKAKQNKGKNAKNRKQKKEDIYQYPLGKSPCGDETCLKKCIEFLDRRSQIKCEEKGKTYILDQSKIYPRYEVIKFFIDKGVITDPEASTIDKCDNVVLIKDAGVSEGRGGTAILVELKGVDTKHALEQLSATLNQQQLQSLWDNQRRVFGRVVCRSTPPRIRNTEEYMSVKEAFYKRNGNIKIVEEKMAEEYDELERLRGK